MKNILIVLLLSITFVGCAGYVPGRQSYWDAQVKEMCEKDGGVTIFERIRMSKADIDRRILPMTADGKLGIALKELAHSDAPVYAERKTTYLRESNPQVGRVEWIAIRRSDQVVVARWISYGRFGGDLPTGLAHDSSFGCPVPRKITSDLQQLFIVEGDSK